MAYDDGGTRSFGYDLAGRLTTDVLTTSDGTTSASLTYGWSCEDELISEIVDLPGNPDSGDHTYTYDQAGRLTSWNPDGDATNASTCGTGTPTGETYTYDNRGNRLTAGTESFTYDDRNRLTSDGDGTYTWTPAGAMDTYTPTNGDPVEDYDHDAAHRLAAVSSDGDSIEYTYDAFDRVATRAEDPFTYAGRAIDPTSDGTDLYARTPSQGLLAVQSEAGFRHPVTDIHGDIVGLADPSGTLAGTTVYNPYGEVQTRTGETSLLGFQGDWTDPDTDHVWMGARWYQPSSGTFLTRDTYNGELSTPFSLNRYTYANNNPTAYWDPDGRMAIPTGKIAKIVSRAAAAAKATKSAAAAAAARSTSRAKAKAPTARPPVANGGRQLGGSGTVTHEPSASRPNTQSNIRAGAVNQQATNPYREPTPPPQTPISLAEPSAGSSWSGGRPTAAAGFNPLAGMFEYESIFGRPNVPVNTSRGLPLASGGLWGVPSSRDVVRDVLARDWMGDARDLASPLIGEVKSSPVYEYFSEVRGVHIGIGVCPVCNCSGPWWG
jgi:RHS repeat-associated protein